MERNIETFIKLVFPTSLLGDNNLTPLERLILIYILSLCKKYGYCWATNEFFSNSFNVSKQTISKSISSLFNYGYIVLQYDKKEKNNFKRKIIVSEVFKKRISDIQENLNTSNQENFKQYNKNNNIRKNIGPVIEYDNECNIISWNGKPTVSEPMSEEEIKELNRKIATITEEQSGEEPGESDIIIKVNSDKKELIRQETIDGQPCVVIPLTDNDNVMIK